MLTRVAATFFVIAASALVVAPNAPAQNQKWVPLFDGKTLDVLIQGRTVPIPFATTLLLSSSPFSSEFPRSRIRQRMPSGS